jgi:hypothetical protein
MCDFKILLACIYATILCLRAFRFCMITYIMYKNDFPHTQAVQEEEEKGPGTYCTRMRWDLHSDRSRYHSDRLWVCMMCISMDDSIRLPQVFLGSPGACACNGYQAFSPLEGPGYEAKNLYKPYSNIII